MDSLLITIKISFQFQNFLNQSQLGLAKNSTQIINQDNSSKSTSKQKAEIKRVWTIWKGVPRYVI